MNKLPSLRGFFPKLSLIFCLFISPVGVNAQKPPEFQKQPDIPTFVVRGRVVYDNTDRPVRRAQVLLSELVNRRPGPDLTTATDRDGRFVLANVPPGSYFAFINEPGVITPLAFMAMGENGPLQSPDLKSLKEYCTEVVVNSSDVEVTVRAYRGGAISGKVTYSDGDPAVNADIAIIRRTNEKSSRILAGLNATALMALHTDDRGRYRVTGLPPGEYLVSAGEKNTAPGNKTNRGYGLDELFGSADALAVTYYGGTTNVADALKLQVERQSELTDIDITLPDLTPHAIRGSVIAKLDRIPLPGATIALRMKEQPDWLDRGARQITTNDQGQWVVEDVPDGTYILKISPPSDIPIPGASPLPVSDESEEFRGAVQFPTRKFVPTQATVSVSGGDLVVEPIALAEGASISGTIEVPGELKENEGIFFQIVWQYEGESQPGPRHSTGAYGESFVIEGLQEGKVYLSAMFMPYGLKDEQSKYYVKSISLNGADITHKPIALKEGQSVKGVRIVIGQGRGNATVKVINAEGKPATWLRVALVPADPSRWLFANEIIEGTTDSKGETSFSSAPGEYLVIVNTVDGAWPLNAEAIRLRSEAAPRIKLSSGENKKIVVTVP